MALVLLAAATAPVAAQTVTDGDTIKFGAQRVRLFGIDAPEKRQTCDDGAWLPGPLATAAPTKKTKKRTVRKRDAMQP
jgi:endonuclease YncB( thermonuclease family)